MRNSQKWAHYTIRFVQWLSRKWRFVHECVMSRMWYISTCVWGSNCLFWREKKCTPRVSTCGIYTWDMTHSYVGHDLFMHVTYLHICPHQLSVGRQSAGGRGVARWEGILIILLFDFILFSRSTFCRASSRRLARGGRCRRVFNILCACCLGWPYRWWGCWFWRWPSR